MDKHEKARQQEREQATRLLTSSDTYRKEREQESLQSFIARKLEQEQQSARKRGR